METRFVGGGRNWLDIIGAVLSLSGAVSNLARVGENVVGRWLTVEVDEGAAVVLVKIPCKSEEWVGGGDWGAGTGCNVTSGYGGGGGGGCLIGVGVGGGGWLILANWTSTSLKLKPGAGSSGWWVLLVESVLEGREFSWTRKEKNNDIKSLKRF